MPAAGRLFLSLAAAVSLEKLRGWLHPTAHIVRAMPNTPMQIGEGASVFANAPNVTNDDRALVHRILASAGRAWEVDEKQVDAITALSRQRPRLRLPFSRRPHSRRAEARPARGMARDLAIQTVLGSAQLAAQSSLTPLELAAQVEKPSRHDPGRLRHPRGKRRVERDHGPLPRGGPEPCRGPLARGEL